ncbi:MAG: MFS transporter [Rhodospirillaceae bacterium]|nr:MFS transporter [Rhodospirillaceae bacterium]
MNTLIFIRKNLRFLGFGLVLMTTANFGQTFYIALFGDHIRAAFSLSHAGFGSVYSAATLSSALVLAIIGRRIDDMDLRSYTAFIAVGLAAAALMMSWAPGIIALGLALFGLRLTGQGLMSHAAITSMGRYFSGQRGRAMSIAGLGMPLGEALFPLLAVTAVGIIGWRQTWAATGILMVIIAIPLLLWLLKGHGDRHADLIERTASDKNAKAANRQWTRREVLWDRRFHLVLPGVLMPPFIMTGLFFHQAQLATMKGWPLSWLATAFVGYAVFHVIGSVAGGFMVDRFGSRNLLVYYQLPLVLGLLVLASFDAKWVAFFYLSTAALTVGASLPVVNSMWAEVYGVTHLGAIKAMTSSMMVFSTAVSPIAAGWLLDTGVSIDSIALLAAGGSVLAVFLFYLRIKYLD